jgi:hypothetical protein
MTDSSFGWNIINKPEVKKPTIHIVVHGGLIQEVFAENVDVEVVLYDLDGDDANERELDMDVAMLRKTTKKVY